MNFIGVFFGQEMRLQVKEDSLLQEELNGGVLREEYIVLTVTLILVFLVMNT